MGTISNPNTGMVKFIPLALGVAGGLGVSAGIRSALPEPDRTEQLRAKGVETLSSRQASVYAMAAPFSIAAGIGLGLQRRTPTSGMTTTTQIAAAALLSTVAGAVINADSDRAGDYVTGIGTMSALTGAGIIVGVRDEIRVMPVRMAGLSLFGAAVGVALPMVFDAASTLPSRVSNGFEHREQ